ncbi:hypothetical protein CAL7716_101080 (plasmid) [Calothrix sp. PCC 7716]|nr:hypothetical protein CAL7716_101080 [Calothrix sp. PCC 7716]
MKNIVKRFAIISCIILGFFLVVTTSDLVQAKNNQMQQATVTKIQDGDTLLAKIGNRIEKIRLACIDTPEIGQSPFDKQATQRLSQLAPVGQTINVKVSQQGRDKSGRLVAEIYQGDTSVNLQLVREGRAVIFCKYLSNCAGSRNSFLSAERAARSEGLGVWNPSNSWKQARESKPCSGNTASTTIPPTPMPIRAAKQGQGCECPYDLDRRGGSCGGRSSYSRPGGEAPVCYTTDR